MKPLGKKILYLCLGVAIFMLFFNSCKSTEQKNLEKSRQTMHSIESCMNEKSTTRLKSLFSSQGASAIDEDDIAAVFSAFPDGITVCETPSDDYLLTTDWVEGNNSVRNIEWSREVVNHATGDKYVMIVLECTSNWSDPEAIGIIRLVLYSVEDENDFQNWWSSLEDTERPNGIILYTI